MIMASLALRKAVWRRLKSHAGLAALMGEARVYDEPLRLTDYPYITLGDARIDDWSTDTSRGHEHVLALNVYSRHGGRREAQILAGEILQVLEDMPADLDGHRLVHCRFTTAEVRREEDGKTYRATIRFRAVTEAKP